MDYDCVIDIVTHHSHFVHTRNVKKVHAQSLSPVRFVQVLPSHTSFYYGYFADLGSAGDLLRQQFVGSKKTLQT
jgi:hypothetical protein